MAGPWDLVDDHVSYPSFSAAGVELLAAERRARSPSRSRTVAMSTRTAAVAAASRRSAAASAAGVPTDVIGERAEAGEHATTRSASFSSTELDVVDLAHQPTIAIHELTVEQLEHRPHPTACADGSVLTSRPWWRS
jgi:hypothetical protein